MPERAPRRELVVVGRDLRYKYGLSNENPDDFIRRKGMAYLEELERDAHLASILQTRRQKLIEKGWKIVPHVSADGTVRKRDQRIRDEVMWAIEAMQGAFEKDIEGMLDATGKGFSLSEINYQLADRGPLAGKITLASIRKKPAKYFSFKFDEYGHYTIRQIDPEPNGIDLPREKFIHLIHGFDDENPYGDSLTSKCAFWVWLKKNQAKFWAIFNERFGMPLTKVEVPRNAKAEEKEVAQDIIENVQTTAGIEVPEGFGVEFLEALRRGDITYDNFIERCNKEMSKLILGATLISEEGKRGQGSYALSTTHGSVLETYTVFDAITTQVAINEQLIRRLVNYNYDTDYYPRFQWSGMSVSSLISVAQALAQLAQSGMQIPISWIHEMTGIPPAREGEPVLSLAPPAAQGSALNLNGLDNRSAANFSLFPGVSFADLPDDVADEVTEADLLRRRYLREARSIQDRIVAVLEETAKKKV